MRKLYNRRFSLVLHMLALNVSVVGDPVDGLADAADEVGHGAVGPAGGRVVELLADARTTTSSGLASIRVRAGVTRNAA